MAFLSLLVAIVVGLPSASPSPSASPRAIRTIVTVVSSPYCNALADHFNGALVPMLANDRVFDVVSVQLDDLNQVFTYPDYQNRFIDLRLKMLRETTTLNASLAPMHDQIDKLRQAASLSTDPQAVSQMRDAASDLEQVYKHQMQLSVDLAGLAHSMMEYPIGRGYHPLNGWTPEENAMPADEKNIKSYLRFERQRSSIDDSEDRAVNAAETIAETHCTKP